MQALLQKVWFAGLLAVLAAGGVRGDVVYTTNPTAIGGNTNASGNVLPATADANGYGIGTFGASTTPTFSFAQTGGQNNRPVVRFNTGGNASDRWQINSLNSVFFIDDMNVATPSKLLSGTATWQLFSGTSSTALATFNQSLKEMDWTTSLFSPNVYQNNPWTLTSGTNELNGATDYTLLLSAVSNVTLSAAANGDELHWTFYSTAPTGSQPFTLNSAGYVTNVGGAYSGTSSTVGSNLAFDLVATSVAPVPEPGTLALGAIAALGGAGGWWNRRRKAKAQVQTAEEPAATV